MMYRRVCNYFIFEWQSTFNSHNENWYYTNRQIRYQHRPMGWHKYTVCLFVQ